MSEERNNQVEPAVVVDPESTEATESAPLNPDVVIVNIDSASGPAHLLPILAVFFCCSVDEKSVTAPRSAGNLPADIEEFIPGMQRYWNNIFGRELPTEEEETLRKILPAWNTFLQPAPAERTEANESEALKPDVVIVNIDSASGLAHFLPILAVFFCCSADEKSVTAPRSTGYLAAEIEEFISGVRRYRNNIYGWKIPTHDEEILRKILPVWNAFLQPAQGVQRGVSAIISSDINKDINLFIAQLEDQGGVQVPEVFMQWIQEWLARWNIFLQARAGETPVTGFNLFFTIVEFILYLVDLASDIGAAIFYASNGQWWQALVTLAIVYGAVIFRTIENWRGGRIRCTGAADWLRCGVSLLVNWPDVKQYWEYCRLEWQLYRSPTKNARLVPEWYQRRTDVAYFKFSEGLWEACPQAVLQLCLLVPDLYGAWTWTDYLRIGGACVSLCTAGAALVNREKYYRFDSSKCLPLGELVVLHVWAVPVTVSRLLSVALLLSVHPYWALVGGALHLVLHGVYWCRTESVPRALKVVITMCLNTLRFCMSPFAVRGSIKYRRVSHAIHFLGNTAMTVVWALGTPLVCAHPALYTATICFNAVMFAVGLVAWQLHEKHWPDSYFIHDD